MRERDTEGQAAGGEHTQRAVSQLCEGFDFADGAEEGARVPQCFYADDGGQPLGHANVLGHVLVGVPRAWNPDGARRRRRGKGGAGWEGGSK
eukprot:1586854-Prymnesium_polylepis.1